MDLLKVLSIGSGKAESLETQNILNTIAHNYKYDTAVRLFLDKSYFAKPGDKEEIISKFEDHIKKLEGYDHEHISFAPLPEEHFHSNCDAFEFMERTRIKFDIILLHRILEHIPMDKVLYFIYLLSTVTVPELSTLSIIVPDYKFLGQMIFSELVGSPNFDKHNILVTTELLNEVTDPHASIWTTDRLQHFFEYEDRFKITESTRFFKFDKRDVYIHALIQRT